jgi:hypothetical protein
MKIFRVFFCILALSLVGTLTLEAQTYDNSASNLQTVPEVIWATASGGGTWKTEIQICNRSGTSNAVYAYFDYYGGGTRGPFLIHTFSSTYHTYKWGNFLSYMQSIDSGFNYYNRVGKCEFYTSDSGDAIVVTARTVNGNYSKTLQGLNHVDSNTIENIDGSNRAMAIMNLSNNSTYRAAAGFGNITANSIEVEFKVIGTHNNLLGSTFTRTIAGFEFISFNPLTEAGIPYPGTTVNQCYLVGRPRSGTGQLVGFGATSHNTSNDPGAHITVNWSIGAVPGQTEINAEEAEKKRDR